MATNKQARLRRYLINKLAHYPNAHQMSIKNDWSFGSVYDVLGGGYSPTLYNQIFPPRKRDNRIIITLSLEQIARFNAQRGDVSRADWLAELMDLADGIGEII